MANGKDEQKAVAKHLYMKGVSTEQILSLTKVCRQTLSRWINKEGWKEEKASRSMSQEEITYKVLGKIGDAIDSAETDEKGLSRMSDSLIKAAKGLQVINKQTTLVNKVDTFIEFETWMVKHREDYPDLTDDVIKLINRLHTDFMEIKFVAK